MCKVLLYSCLILGLVLSCQAQCNPSPTTVSGTHAPTGQICSGDLIFEENFDDLDFEKWNHESTLAGGGNWEFQWYTNSRYNSYTDGGSLYIQPTLTADETGEDFLSSGNLDLNGGSPADECTDPQFYGCMRDGTPENYLNPVKSARLRTVYSFNFMYGKIEVRAKLPAGDWVWPGIWMLPRWNKYSFWPMSGEIDIMEGRGNRDYVNPQGVNIGTQQISSTVHWGPAWNLDQWPLTHGEKQNDAGWDTDWHNYQMSWDENSMTISVDDDVILRIEPPAGGFWELGNLDSSGFDNPWKRSSNIKMAPFDQQYYILLEVACGGMGFFPDDSTNAGGKPWSNTSPTASTDFWRGRDQWLPTWQLGTDNAALKIDYVRVWAA